MSSSATGHFIVQRGTAMLLAVLGLWFAISLAGLDSMRYEAVLAFVAQPLNSLLLALLGATLAWHSWLGIHVIIDDYVHSPRLNWLANMFSRVFHLVVGLLSVYSLYEIGFGA